MNRNPQIERESHINDRILCSQQMEILAQKQVPNPMNYCDIRESQRDDCQLEEFRNNHTINTNFREKRYGEVELWERKSATDGEYRIFLPKDLREGIMEWYHLALMHPGAGRMEASIRRCFTWPNCREDVRNYVKNCDE